MRFEVETVDPELEVKPLLKATFSVPLGTMIEEGNHRIMLPPIGIALAVIKVSV